MTGTVRVKVDPATLKRWSAEVRELRRQALYHLHKRHDALVAEIEAEIAKAPPTKEQGDG